MYQVLLRSSPATGACVPFGAAAWSGVEPGERGPRGPELLPGGQAMQGAMQCVQLKMRAVAGEKKIRVR